MAIKLTHDSSQSIAIHHNIPLHPGKHSEYLTASESGLAQWSLSIDYSGLVGANWSHNSKTENHETYPEAFEKFHWPTCSVVLHVCTPILQSTIQQPSEQGFLIEPRLGAGKPLPRLGFEGSITALLIYSWLPCAADQSYLPSVSTSNSQHPGRIEHSLT